MAVAALTLPESLRPWQAAGVTHLLVARPAAAPAPPPEAPSDVWPEPWRGLLNNVTRPARTVWTYLALGEDLGGRPDPRRREVLLRLTKALAWPKGSIAYWPPAVLQGDALVPDPALFWQGVAAIQARCVVCFGRRTAEILFPGRDCPTGLHAPQDARPGTSLLVLPDMDEIIAGGADALSAAVTLLGQVRLYT